MNKGIRNGHGKNIAPILIRNKSGNGMSNGILKHSLKTSNVWADMIAYDYVFVKNSHISTINEKILIYNYLLSKLTIGSYYYVTFGPSGQNKKEADFLYFWRTSGDITTRSVTKPTGAILRWDIDGDIIFQNNLPAYTKGTNAGYIILSSTDGWTTITSFQIFFNNFIGYHPAFQLQNALQVYTYRNAFTGIIPTNLYAPNCADLEINQNLFTGDMPILTLKSTISVILNHTNDLTTLTLLPAPATTQYNAASNNLTTVAIDDFLHRFNLARQSIPPTANLVLTLNGIGMASPTGGSSNVDLVNLTGVIYPAAGKTLTALIN